MRTVLKMVGNLERTMDGELERTATNQFSRKKTEDGGAAD
jgi:hypothetical protein